MSEHEPRPPIDREEQETIALLLAAADNELNQNEWDKAQESYDYVVQVCRDRSGGEDLVDRARQGLEQIQVAKLYAEAERHWEMSNHQAARQGFERVLQIDPTHVGARVRLQAALAALPRLQPERRRWRLLLSGAGLIVLISALIWGLPALIRVVAPPPSPPPAPMATPSPIPAGTHTPISTDTATARPTATLTPSATATPLPTDTPVVTALTCPILLTGSDGRPEVVLQIRQTVIVGSGAAIQVQWNGIQGIAGGCSLDEVTKRSFRLVHEQANQGDIRLTGESDVRLRGADDVLRLPVGILPANSGLTGDAIFALEARTDAASGDPTWQRVEPLRLRLQWEFIPVTPTWTPRPTATPTSTYTPTLTPTPEILPITLLEPATEYSASGVTSFRWQGLAFLPPGIYYEVVGWREGEDPSQARGWAGSIRDTGLNIDVRKIAPPLINGTYYWTVLPITREPVYRPLIAPSRADARVIYIRLEATSPIGE